MAVPSMTKYFPKLRRQDTNYRLTGFSCKAANPAQPALQFLQPGYLGVGLFSSKLSSILAGYEGGHQPGEEINFYYRRYATELGLL